MTSTGKVACGPGRGWNTEAPEHPQGLCGRKGGTPKAALLRGSERRKDRLEKGTQAGVSSVNTVVRTAGAGR